MLALTNLTGFMAGGGTSPFLFDIISDLGLTANLNTVLDAADLRSTDGVSSTWTDVNGTSDWAVAGGANSPTFNGVAGDGKDSTYWSFNGSQYFTNTTATYYDAWFKNNGAFTLLHVLFASGGGTQTYYSVNGTNFDYFRTGTNKLSTIRWISNGGQETITSSIGAAGSSWNFVGTAYDEATTNMDFVVNASTDLGNVTAASTRTNNLSPTTSYMATDSSSFMANGSRLACVAFWSVALTSTQLNLLYTTLKQRRFTTLP